MADFGDHEQTVLFIGTVLLLFLDLILAMAKAGMYAIVLFFDLLNEALN